mgnify:CR=1 FL=1
MSVTIRKEYYDTLEKLLNKLSTPFYDDSANIMNNVRKVLELQGDVYKMEVEFIKG